MYRSCALIKVGHKTRDTPLKARDTLHLIKGTGGRHTACLISTRGKKEASQRQNLVSCNVFTTHRFHKGIRGNRPEGFSPVRHEEAHLSEELWVLQRPHAVRLTKRGA